ncbi:DNA-protecting protein DprA [Allopusillimonas soli]|uniref:DNA-protecting protein DprA n=1 Tax=Allopusillimonas soli TaxID=659016 RepID=A0A853FCA3_9BURK|nr:DNA-processing protein DprA [Allopusillimonas soli]NYT37539.1 DNA-protecting protein DprA [Allopusillimonas soli]TEA74865.1 DNA-protecting protein DprA [Allopusillimonas soli]
MSATPTSEELRAWLRLSLEPDLPPMLARHLLTAIGLPQDIYAASLATLSRNVPDSLARQMKQPLDEGAEQHIIDTLAWLQAPGHHLLTLADPGYPASLLESPDPPAVLYVHGDPALLCRPGIAVVGARSATPGGMDNARAFSRHLAARGWPIVSGLAQGIDAAAHEGALEAGPGGGRTIAVLGTGIDIVYPAAHRALAHRIAAEGALVTEFPLGTRAVRFHFPKRNRIVAGLSRGVLVVEAARQSGSLITARLAAEIGRDIFAIPGSIHSPLSRGCHALIRQGARLVESEQDILEELMGPASSGAISSASMRETAHASRSRPTGQAELAGIAPLGKDTDPAIQHVLSALGHDPVHMDILAARTGLDMPRLNSALLSLELAGRISRLADGRYQQR